MTRVDKSTVITGDSVAMSAPRRPVKPSPRDPRNPNQDTVQIKSGPGFSSKSSQDVSEETEDKI